MLIIQYNKFNFDLKTNEMDLQNVIDSKMDIQKTKFQY